MDRSWRIDGVVVKMMMMMSSTTNRDCADGGVRGL